MNQFFKTQLIDTVPSKQIANWVCHLEGDCFGGLWSGYNLENQYSLEELAHKQCFHKRGFFNSSIRLWDFSECMDLVLVWELPVWQLLVKLCVSPGALTQENGSLFKPQQALKRGKNNPQPSGLQLMKVDLFSNAVWRQDAAINVQLSPAHFSVEFFWFFFRHSFILKYSLRDFSRLMIFEVMLSPCLFFNSHLAPDSTCFLIYYLPFCMH